MTRSPDRQYFWQHLLEQASQEDFFDKNAAVFSRRAMLAKCFNGMGALGLAAAVGPRALGGEVAPAGPLMPKQPHLFNRFVFVHWNYYEFFAAADQW